MTIEYRTGDLIRRAQYGADRPDKLMIGHVCNNAGAWGAGFVVPLGTTFPVAKYWYESLKAYPLGFTQFVRYGDKLVIANMIAQDNIAAVTPLSMPNRVVWKSLDRTLIQAFLFCQSEEIEELWLPRIGAGIGGAHWEDVEAAIEDAHRYGDFGSSGPKIVVWTLESEVGKFPIPAAADAA